MRELQQDEFRISRRFTTLPEWKCAVEPTLACLSLSSPGVDRGFEDLQLHLHPYLCSGVCLQAGSLWFPALLQGQVSI